MRGMLGERRGSHASATWGGVAPSRSATSESAVDRSGGTGSPEEKGPARADADEPTRLRREVRQPRQERHVLSRAAARFARETGALPSGSPGS